MEKNALYGLVKKIPQGRVTNYGTLARLLGEPRAARQVGRLLHQNNEPKEVPCHRVVFKDGSLTPAFAFGATQRAWLEEEGVGFIGERVDMDNFFTIPIIARAEQN